MSKSILQVIFLCCVLCRAHFGCVQPDSAKRLCISADLGRFKFVGIDLIGPKADSSKIGCQAEYKGRNDQVAVVRVIYRDRESKLEQVNSGMFYSFNRQWVNYQTIDQGILVLWNSDRYDIELRLQKGAVPSGPVLRAYLFRYRSRMDQSLEELRKKQVLLGNQAKRLTTTKATGSFRLAERPGKIKQSNRPQLAKVHLELARNYRKQGNTIMAAQEYHVSFGLDSSCQVCYLELGSLYFELKHWDLSIRALLRAIELAPKNPDAYILIGDVYFTVRNGKQALRAYQTVVEKLKVMGPEKKRINSRIVEIKKGDFDKDNPLKKIMKPQDSQNSK